MTKPPEAQHRPRRSLRVRMVGTFAGLAVAPFVLALAGLFFLAHHDVGKIQGEALAQDARLLVDLVHTQMESSGRSASGIASLPEVRGHLAGTEPYPHAVFSALRRSIPGLQRVELVPGAAVGGAPVGAAEGSVSWGTAESLEYIIGVNDLQGRQIGHVEVSFDLSRLRRSLEWFRSGNSGRAALYTQSGRLLVGSPDVPLPPVPESAPGWERYEDGGRDYFAGVAPVTLWGSILDPGWFLAVVEPAEDVFGPFYFVARQMALLLAVFALALGALAWRMADQFLQPILRIRNGAEIVARTNLAHRIEVDTDDELQDLAEAFNDMAENLEGAYGELEERVRQTTRSLQEERNRLATVLRTMVEGVVVANESGDVLLMNPRARLALGSGPSSGIGMPLGKIVPAERLEYHLKRLRRIWDEGREAVEQVAFPLNSGALLRGVLSGVPGPGGERAGFLLVFRDSLPAGEGEPRVEDVLREMPELLRGPAATSRSLVETLQRHPEMPAPKREAFLAAVREELARMTERVQVAEEAASAAAGSRWSGVSANPKELLEDAVAAVPGMFARMQISEDEVPPVVVEPFAWVAGLSTVLRWMAEKSSGWSPLVASLRVEDGMVVTCLRLDEAMEVDPAEIDDLPVAPRGEPPRPLGQVVKDNRGEMWARPKEGGFEVCFGLVSSVGSRAAARRGGIADEQPEFYNFDLFLPRPAHEAEGILGRPLQDLEYVVFDTETTGLQPSKGDEVVSLSAVRVLRGKVHTAGDFHALINPGRPIPPTSTDFHGIVDEMVADAPPITEVLPQFYDYVGRAVLVAHNAAFDKKFLDIAAGRAGLPYLENPILDTLFLSYGIHRDFEGHNLDAIAARLGVRVEARHTSLGDARATAEIFLKLLSLLDSRGVRTLGEAEAYCDRMLLLRWQSSRF